MKIKTGDISIVENAGTFLLWYDSALTTELTNTALLWTGDAQPRCRQATLLIESSPEGAEFVSPAGERWVRKAWRDVSPLGGEIKPGQTPEVW